MDWTSVAYWDRRWQDERSRSLYGKRRKETDHVEWWNRRAKGFADRYSDRNGNDPRDDILEMIRKSGFVDSKAEMLDIGCGPGNYAIPLAREFRKIVALDASPEMLSILEKRAETEGISNIETVCLSWEDVDLDEMNWRGRFGLVAAIKSPAIRNAESLRKLLDASGAGCLYNGFVMREDHAQAEIWRMAFEEPKPPVPADAFFVYQLVHAMGLFPSLQLRRYIRENSEDMETAEKELNLLMAPYEASDVNMAEQVRKYVMEKSVEGTFNKVCRSEEGIIFWSVKGENRGE